MAEFKVTVIGGSGYTGIELIRILLSHPAVRLSAVSSSQYTGQAVSSVFASLAGRSDLTFVGHDDPSLSREVDLIFTAVPHQKAMARVPSLLEGGRKVIDLSADFRFDDAALYAQWYQDHTAPELLAEAVYGLPELYRDRIKAARLVANPGCYPTSVILALAPLLTAGVVFPGNIIADSKSGVTGAGRKADVDLSFCEVNDSIKAYAVATHRHTPEIEQEISKLAGAPVTVSFTPHLTPMSRGILSTVYANMTGQSTTDELLGVMAEFYADAPFVQVLPAGRLPRTQDVRGTNFCHLGAVADPRTNRAVVVSAIDNLCRGASGMAVANMNLMLGLEETTGLMDVALAP
ncbi:MAG: N-acetyl-gamma-glutamyl-phosphate reductase [Proteobacteria bacterium]|nr:N-acetyl-gamma-glutamyl-phosphate reductase [Pseudomonadota bacterium]MBU1743082.1 N-acetyl-gamma-glutamyl-phosphate reductase [Pseudomonadota bacterium]